MTDIRSLIASYQTDPDSPYHKLRFRSRQNSEHMAARVARDHGDELAANIKARTLLAWHASWKEGGHISMAHGLIGQLRTLFGFGATFLEDAECERLCRVMHNMRFEQAKAREERMTAEQAAAVIAKAHELGRHSLALGQAFQFELMLRQKDVIGEWLPLSEPGASDVAWRDQKWCAGLRWDEIDADMILRHTTSKRQKPIEVNLRLAPMVMDELANLSDRECFRKSAKVQQLDRLLERVTDARGDVSTLIEPLSDALERARIGFVAPPMERHHFPQSGPIIVCEETGRPWTEHEFRRKWRKVADAAGLPRAVKNMDTRAGAITEALLAGAPMDSVRKSATHSDASMTQRYSRGDATAAADVAQFRAAHRNKVAG